MLKLSREEIKILNRAVIIFACVLFFVIFFYIPRSKALARLKSKVDKSDLLVGDIKKMIGENTSLELGIGVLKKEAAILSTKYIDQKDMFLALNRLSEAADMAGVRVVSTSPQSLSVFSSGGLTPKYYDRSCLKLPVKMVIEARYEELASYLHSLEYSPVGIYTIEGFSIKKDKNLVPDLKMDITVDLYIFGDENTMRKI